MSPDGLGSPTINSNSNSNSSNNSNIRVFVHWHDSQAVFAGEEIKCTITFKNVARPAGSPTNQSKLASSPQQPGQGGGSGSGGGSGRLKAGSSGLAPSAAIRGHRSTLSLTVPSAAASSRSRAGSIPWSPPNVLDSRPPSSSSSTRNGHGHGHGHGHKRSVSILSIGSAASAADDNKQNSNAGLGPAKSQQRPGRGHMRASSLQIVPTRGSPTSGSRSATYPPRSNGSQSSPLFNASYPPDRSMLNGRLSGASTAPNTPRVGSSARSPRPGPDAMPNWRFPMTSSPLSEPKTSPTALQQDDPMSPASTVGEAGANGNGNGNGGLAVRLKDPIPTINEHVLVAPATRILSTTSIAGTPRSSGEFYSLSNNSSETLASEYVTHQHQHQHQHQPSRSLNGRPPHFRRTSNLSSTQSSATRAPETLMMGYAQIQGSFTLDGSLVNLGPFEQVKRKAVVGGQGGGGVVGVETAGAREGGLLKSLGWGSFTSSIGELLGGGELSSIREMRGIASSKSIPLLSTPQSILFVDLQLAPGESRTFEYAFTLPRGLPPTHRGKAMKISYGLVIGTQRPGGVKEQQVRSVDVPFRVLGSVNSHGEILGHDLMSPYIILRDQARVRTLETHASGTLGAKRSSSNGSISAITQLGSASGSLSLSSSSTVHSFLSYVDELLAQPRYGSSGGLLSPTATTPSSRRPSSSFAGANTTTPFDGGSSSGGGAFPFTPSPTTTTMMATIPTTSAREAIDLAILRSNLTGAGRQSANRFEIARNGRRVGVVMLARPAYRLGEAVSVAVDFAGAEVPCYAVHASLETAETVDSSLALRSEASVLRATRRVLAASSEACLFARRVVFAPAIPVSAAPEFVTSGVSLEWKIRLEFVVPAASAASASAPSGEEERDGNGNNEEEDDDGEDDDGEEEDDNDERRKSHRSRPGAPRQQQQQQQQQQPRGSNSGGNGSNSNNNPPHPLLEEISRDDRGGLVLVAAENLACESFEVAVPLRVYGAVCTGLERLDRDEATEAGLVV